jgi:hypothetical protein
MNKALRCTTSAAAGKGLGTTIKYLRGAAGIGLGTTVKYLRRATSAAANKSLSATINHLANQNAGAGTNLSRPAHMHTSYARTQMNPPVA